MPVTDLQFIDYCIERFDKGDSRRTVKAETEMVINESEYVYLKIGLTRPFKKAANAEELCYLQVNGVYTEILDGMIRRFAKEPAEGKQPVHIEKTNSLHFKLFDIPLQDSKDSLNVYVQKSGKNEKLLCESLSELTDSEKTIYEYLKQWRNDQAKSRGIAKYMLLSNKSLMSISKFRPKTTEQLLKIYGLGEKKVKEYGDGASTVVIESDKD